MTEPDPPAGRYAFLLQALHRHRLLLALLSFVAGVASFVLVQRQEWLAQPIALFLLLSWLGILLEPALARRRLPPALLRFGIQAVHQETFFFVLPFFYLTTAWTTPQAAFTVALTLASVATLWDPLYHGRIAERRGLYLVFHAIASFVAALVALPLILRLDTGQSLGLATVVMLLVGASAAVQQPDAGHRPHWAAALAGGVLLGALAFVARPWIPPATLWVESAMVTAAVDPQSREPELQLVNVPVAQLHGGGLFAWTAIHAPRGLRERVFHRWLLDGQEVDRIPMEIVGGREQGYRAWSHKRGFPANPRGEWTVQVLTEGGQLIGQFGFRAL